MGMGQLFIPATRLLQRMQGTVRPLGPSCILARKRLCGHGVLGMLPRSPPSALQAPDLRWKEQRYSVSKGNRACIPETHPQGRRRRLGGSGLQTHCGGHRRRTEAWGWETGSERKARQVGCPSGLSDPCVPPPAFKGPICQWRDGRVLGGSQPATCCGYSKNAGQASPLRTPWGQEVLEARSPALSLQAPESVLTALSPYCSEDKGAALLGTAQPRTFLEILLGLIGRDPPSLLTRTERSQCVACVGTQWAAP